MNQNENKPLTADETLKKWCEYTYPSLPDAAKMALQTACHSYAAQQVEQVTKERDKAVDLLDESRVQLQYLDKRFPTGTTPNVLGRIETFLNSLNAAGSDTGKK